MSTTHTNGYQRLRNQKTVFSYCRFLVISRCSFLDHWKSWEALSSFLFHFFLCNVLSLMPLCLLLSDLDIDDASNVVLFLVVAFKSTEVFNVFPTESC